MKTSHFLTLVLLTLFPICNAFGFNDRSLASYFTGNIIWRVIFNGGYYSLGVFVALVAIALISSKARTMIVSLFMALFALFLFVLMYEVVEEMSWVETMPGS